MKSYENILTSFQQRYEYGDSSLSDLNESLHDLSAENLIANSAVYHRSCYQKLTNVAHLERVKERFVKSPDPVLNLQRKHVLEGQPMNKNKFHLHLKKEFIGLLFHL